jgi:hypothetical protein
LTHIFCFKDKRSPKQARNLILTLALHGDHGYQSKYYLGNEEGVKAFFRQHGYDFEVVVEQVRNRQSWVPILDVRTFSSLTLGGAPGSHAAIRGPGDKEIVTFKGETGHVVFSEYMDIFEHAVEELNRSVERSNINSKMYRDFLSSVSDGIASLEAYINYRADLIGGPQFSDSKQQKVSFDDKIDLWIPEITGRKLDKGGVNWNHFTQLRDLRDDFQAHPKAHVYGTPYTEICRRMNLFRTGVAGLLFDLHLALRSLVPSPVIHGYYLPDIRYVTEPE